MRVPLVDLEALHRPLRDELMESFARVLASARFILGEEVERLEGSIARYCESPFAVGVSSGTDALLTCLMSLGIEPGAEVVTPAYSFFGTAGVVSRLRATPVFVDILEESFNIDPARIEERIGPRTRAIIPVHLYGQCADMAPISTIAERHRVVVIEDAAQAIGARYRDGRRAGSLGRAGCLSFYPSKNLGAMGDAGMIVTHDEALAARCERLRSHGASRDYLHEMVGGNFRLDAVQAAILNVKLRHLDDWTERRIARARLYDALFEESGLVENGLRTPRAAFADSRVDGAHVYHQYVIRADRRDELREYLAGQSIASAIYYPTPLHLQPCFRKLGYAEGDFPVAERTAREALALPMYPDLTEDQQRFVVDAIRLFYRG